MACHYADDILLLTDGRVMYHGPVGEVLAHFRSLGYACPIRKDPGSFLQVFCCQLAGSRQRQPKRDPWGVQPCPCTAPPGLGVSRVAWGSTRAH